MSRGYYFTLKIDEELALKIARVNHSSKVFVSYITISSNKIGSARVPSNVPDPANAHSIPRNSCNESETKPKMKGTIMYVPSPQAFTNERDVASTPGRHLSYAKTVRVGL